MECCPKALLFLQLWWNTVKSAVSQALEVGCLSTSEGVNLVLKVTCLLESCVDLLRLMLICTLCHRSQEWHHHHHFRHFKVE